MRLDDYRLADCTLFRLPPVDASTVDDAVQKAIFEAWQRGMSAQNAIDSVLSDKKIVGALAEQVAPNLEFQQQNAFDEIYRKLDEKRAEYEKWKDEQLQRMNNGIGAEVEKKQEEWQKANAAFLEKYKGYNAAQAQLEMLRTRVRERLEKIGGAEKYAKLLEINQAVMSDSPYQPAVGREPLYDQPNNVLEKTSLPADVKTSPQVDANKARAIVNKKPIDLLNDKTEKSAIKDIPEIPKPKGFFGRVWEVLNYKIW